MTATFKQTAFRVNADTGERRFSKPDFGNWLIGQIYDVQPVFRRRRRWWKREYVCRGCEGPIGHTVDATHRFVLRGAAPFPALLLELELPASRCATCDTWNASADDRAMTNEINEALLAAFASADIR